MKRNSRCGNKLSFLVIQLMQNSHIFCTASVIDNPCTNLHQRHILLFINTVCGATDSKMIKMYFAGTYQINIPVNSAAAVPTGIRHQLVFYTHSGQILPLPDKLRYIHIK